MISNLINIKSKKAISLLALLASLGSFISDVLEPLAPFSKYILILSIFLLIIFRIVGYFKKEIYDEFSYIIIFFWLVAIMSGIVFLLKENTSSRNGIFANYFPIIERTQADLGIIERDVKEIKETTRSIKEDTEEITKKLDNIEKKIDDKKKYLDQSKLPLKYRINFNKNKEIQIIFQPVETPREFYVSEDGGKNFNSLGFLDEIDQRTGLNLPKRIFSFKSNKKNLNIQLKYLDINSAIKGPFNLNIDLIKEFKIFQKKKIKNQINNWVQINNYTWSTNNFENADPSKDTRIYSDWNISFLLENRCAIKNVTIKLDKEHYMVGLDYNKKNHVTIMGYTNVFKEKKILFPSCDFELKKYSFKTSYKPSNYIDKTTYSVEKVFSSDIGKREINMPSHTWEKNFSTIPGMYSQILDLLKYEDMNLMRSTKSKGELKEIFIRVEFFDGESTIFKKYTNPKFN